MAKELTDRQAKIYRYIVEYIGENHYPPTVREIAEAFDISSTNGVSEHLRALIRKGFLLKEASKSRALRPLVDLNDIALEADDAQKFKRQRPEVKQKKPSTTRKVPISNVSAVALKSSNAAVREVPVLGRIAAGAPIFAEENIEETLTLDVSMFCRAHDEVFALRVRGTSMIGDGIMPGDVVFVRPQSTADDGELIAALIDGSATVKRYERRKGVVYLMPSNPEMEPITVSDEDDVEFRILGAIKGVLRQYS